MSPFSLRNFFSTVPRKLEYFFCYSFENFTADHFLMKKYRYFTLLRTESYPKLHTWARYTTVIKTFFKWAFLFIFVLFTSQFNYKLSKCRWCAWDSNQWPKDGRHRQNHGAITDFIMNIFTVDF